MERLLILDSNSLMNRAFYALPPLTNSEGVHTNAVFGFTSMLMKMQEDFKPDYIVATFDKKAPTFRHKEFADYKAGRKKMPPELAEQFPIIKELLTYMDINIFEIDGFEADDLIGTLAKYAEKEGLEVFIVSGDKDSLQLASDNIKVVITKKGITEREIYDHNRMVEDFGVTPTEFIDVKGLMGDTSDNIPGVPGIGEKTAYKLIQEYKSIENVLNNIENISGKKIKENLMTYAEQAIFSKKLATIITEVPVEIDLNSIKSQENYDLESVRKMFFRLGFKSLIDKLPKDDKVCEEFNVDYININTLDELRIFKSEVNKDNIYIYPIIENNSNYYSMCIKGLYIYDNKKVYVVNFNELIKDSECKQILKDIFEDININKISYDSKHLMTVLSKNDINMDGLKFDAKIAAYLIDTNKGQSSLLDLIREYVYVDINDEDPLLNIKEVYNLKKLFIALEEKIKEFEMEKLLYEIELPLCKVLSMMESEGFKVDKEKLIELGENFIKEIETVRNTIYDLAGEEFNISSPKQLGKILFEKLDLPVIKKTKTGYSTNAEVLDELSDKHEIIDKITYYRQVTKIYSTYVEGLKAVIGSDSKIHSNFNQTLTTTGRLSSTEPNLQNIPIKYEMGRAIRKVFVPSNENSIILSADYSQIELRILAAASNDDSMIEAFVNNEDIHTKTASEAFKVREEDVTPLMRSNAKAVNFGIVYGISDFSLGKDLKVSRAEAKRYIDAYFSKYPGVKIYINSVISDAKRDGYIKTMLNRRRYIPEINASNKITSALGERLAMNAPIQGTAADVIKIAMVKVNEELKNRKFKSKLILQVHDELILNVEKDELEDIKVLVKENMESALKLSVPLDIDINLGDTWYDAK